MKTQNKPIRIELPLDRKSPHSLFGSFTALAAGLSLFGGQSSALAQADNFNDGTDTAPTVNWEHADPIFTASGGLSVPNTYDASTFQYHLTADAANGALGAGQARTLSVPPDVYTDFYASVDLVDWSLTTVQAIGLLARTSDIGPGTTDGYAFGILCGGAVISGQNYVRILRIQNEGTKDVLGSGPAGDSKMPIPDLDPAKNYRMVFMGHGTDLEGRLFELPNVVTPIAVVKGNTAGDSIILTNGQCGLLGFGASTAFGVDMTFDNYYASARCPMNISDMVVKDNFNDGNDTAPTIAWQHYDPIFLAGQGSLPEQNTWTFPGGNTYKLTAGISPDAGQLGQGRVASVAPVVQTDFRIAADIVNWDSAISQNIGLMARLSDIGPGSTKGYTFTYDVGGSGDMDVSKITGEAPTGLTLAGSDRMKMIPGNSYRFVFSGKGTELRALVFELPETMNPLVDCVATDATYASGVPGLLGSASGAADTADVTFDNWSDTALVAPAVSVVLGAGPSGEFTATWPANIECVWVLESSPSVGAGAVWTEVSTTTTAGDAAKLLYNPTTGKNTFTAAAPMSSTGNTYYRLKQL